MAGGGLVSALVLGLSSRLDSDIFLTRRASTSPSPPATTARLEMDLDTGSFLTAARDWTNQRSARSHHPPITAHLGLAVVRGGGPRPLLATAATLLARTRDLQVALLLQQYNLYTNQIICFPVFLAIKWQNQVRYCIKNMTFLMTMTIVVQDLILKQLHKNIAFLLFSRGVGFCLAAVCACKYF